MNSFPGVGTNAPPELSNFLQRWSELLPGSDDDVWREWVDFEPRRQIHLLQLMRSECRSSLKARVAYLLLLPSLSWSPFYWKCDHANPINYGKGWMVGLTPELESFVSQLLVTVCDFMASYDPSSDAHAGSVERPTEVMYHLNSAVLTLLAQTADEDNAVELLRVYRLLNPLAFLGSDHGSGYRSFYQLLCEDKLAERWKRAADKRMREIVLAELRGECEPPVPGEAAPGQYLDTIEQLLGRIEPPYSLKLFASQIEFIVSLPEIAPVRNFRPSSVQGILDHLRGDQYALLRLKLARFVLLADHGDDAGESFKISGGFDLFLAKAMLDEFGPQDPEVAARLKPLLEAGEQLVEAANQEERSAEAARYDLEQRMR